MHTPIKNSSEIPSSQKALEPQLTLKEAKVAQSKQPAVPNECKHQGLSLEQKEAETTGSADGSGQFALCDSVTQVSLRNTSMRIQDSFLVFCIPVTVKLSLRKGSPVKTSYSSPLLWTTECKRPLDSKVAVQHLAFFL